MLVDIKAGLCSNSNLLEVNPTQRATNIKVLDGWAYPEFRLVNVGHEKSCAITRYFAQPIHHDDMLFDDSVCQY